MKNDLAFVAIGCGVIAVLIGSTYASSRIEDPGVPHHTGIPSDLNGVVWGADQFVVVGDDGEIATSPDGEDWTRRSSGTVSDLQDVEWNGRVYIAVGANIIVSSRDGKAWTFRSDAGGGSAILDSVGWGNGGFVAFGRRHGADAGFAMVSADGILWQKNWDFGDQGAARAFQSMAGKRTASSGPVVITVGPRGTIYRLETTTVFADGFESGGTGEWSLVVTPPVPTPTPTITPFPTLHPTITPSYTSTPTPTPTPTLHPTITPSYTSDPTPTPSR